MRLNSVDYYIYYTDHMIQYRIELVFPDNYY